MKRVLDFTLALLLIVIVSPIMIIVAIAIWTRLGFPFLFVQRRPGLHNRAFNLVKFRSMALKNPAMLNETDAARLNSFGNFLRKTSLDELPTLFNVLFGQLSLVGPRPLLMEYLPLYNKEQMRRHEVKPGITGWAQINGRNAISWEKKFELDVWYVDNQSFWLDCRILAKTVVKVFKRDGITAQNHATMSKFEGTSPSLNQSSTNRPGAERNTH